MSMLLVHELPEARDRILLLKQRLEAGRSRELPGYASVIDEQSTLNFFASCQPEEDAMCIHFQKRRNRYV